MKTYVCTICGYIYDEAKGDEEQGEADGSHDENDDRDYDREDRVVEEEILFHRLTPPFQLVSPPFFHITLHEVERVQLQCLVQGIVFLQLLHGRDACLYQDVAA